MLKNRIKGLNKSTLFKNEYYSYKSTDKDDNGMYIKKIPLHKYNGRPTLFGLINIRLPSGRITYDVIDQCGQLYAPFYNTEWHPAHKYLISRINRRFKAEIKLLEAKPNTKKKVRKSGDFG